MAQLLNRIFAISAGLAWLSTFGAVLWQFWHYLSRPWQTLNVKMAFESLWGSVPTFTSDQGQVLFALISGLSLVLFLGVCALALSALAKVLE